MNPVTYEVVRNRLLAITDEMRIALQSVSGSPTVTEATDFFTGLYLPDGEFATMGFQVTHEAPPVGALIRHITAAGRPVRDGDMFIGNDPYVGALHQNDVQMAAPVFYGGAIIGWAGVMAHETDVGGMNFASWCSGATEVYQEGLRIPAVKLADRGEVREDVLEMILGRLPAARRARPGHPGLHRHPQRGQDRLDGLCGGNGAETVRGVMARMIADSERAAGERLAALPDGTVHVRDFLEHDGHANRLYTVDLVAAKRGQTLVLDFSGSSPQAPGFINATRAGLARRGHRRADPHPRLRDSVERRPAPAGHHHRPGRADLHRPAPGPGRLRDRGDHLDGHQRRAARAEHVPGLHARVRGSRAGGQLRHHGHLQHGRRQPVRRAVRPAPARPAGRRLRSLRPPGRVSAGGPVAVPMPAVADVETNELVSPLFYRYRRRARARAAPAVSAAATPPRSA